MLDHGRLCLPQVVRRLKRHPPLRQAQGHRRRHVGLPAHQVVQDLSTDTQALSERVPRYALLEERRQDAGPDGWSGTVVRAGGFAMA